MTDNIDDAYSDLIAFVDAISDEEEEKNEKNIKALKKEKDTEDKKDEKSIEDAKVKKNSQSSENKIDKPKQAITDSDSNDDQEKDEEIFMSKEIVKIDEDLATEKRRNEILQQVEITSKNVLSGEQEKSNSDDEQDDDIDLENLDIDWHFHTPSAK